LKFRINDLHTIASEVINAAHETLVIAT